MGYADSDNEDDFIVSDDDAFSYADEESEDDFDFDDDGENVAPNKKKSSSKSKAKSTKAAKSSSTSKTKPKAKAKASVKPKAKAKATTTTKKSTKKTSSSVIDLDDDSDSESFASNMDEDTYSGSGSGSNSTKGGKKKTVEEIYQKKTQLEHILLRPDTYIGSVEPVTQKMHVLDVSSSSDGSDETANDGDKGATSSSSKIISKEITFTPGLFKIFDEILVNAADNKQRDASMDKLHIEIDGPNNTISVMNNGKGIPVEYHKVHKVYVPTLIFGELLTGSNFDDNEKKTTGGRNGYGAKLTNIFSTKFVIECADSESGKKFKQVFRDNMSVREDPKISKMTKTELKKGDYVKITFQPDLPRFKMQTLNQDTVGLLSKRAYDIAGSMVNRGGKKLQVYLNGDKLPIRNFESYLKMYGDVSPPVAYEKVNDQWEVGIGVSEGSFQQISFVNAICTSKGGGHTEYIANQIAQGLASTLKKKTSKGGGTDVKKTLVMNHLSVFVNCLIENPTFDSQTKEFCTTRSKNFGSECKLSSTFIQKVAKSEVVENILAYAKFKDNQALKRSVKGGKKKKLTGITKLDDANFAGSAKSQECTLIITEGDSAKTLAMSGLSVVGRDYYGVFPLKGKPLNVRDASFVQIMKNEEIKNIVEILGLKIGEKYDEKTVKKLRYGHLMIMADQDHDGSHIKGLVINFIHNFWPSLLDVPGFLQQFITPIVKATKGKKTHTFFTLPEYEQWRESTGNNAKGWKVKYYKGLGTSTSAEAKEYFANLDLHEVRFQEISADNHASITASSSTEEDSSDDDEDRPQPAVPDRVMSGNDLIDMAFKKTRVEDRKTWLNNLKLGTYLNYSRAQEDGVKYSEFINKELILFSQADCARSIPHVYDGFKPSQRKILFSCFKRKLKDEIKVAQLAGYVSEHSAYHHGEMSLTSAIVGMAQSFCGSNNINLLTPSGQFGTRRMGGQDAASPRYIFTKLENVTRKIFHPDDDALLKYLEDDGLSIEPQYYMPVIPMILVNGSDGIGTGWSCQIPNYCPRQIVSNLRKLINGDEMEYMKPHYSGWTGEITEGEGTGKFIGTGKIERLDDTTILITELPIKKWTQNYKVFIEGMLDGGKSEPDLTDFKEDHTDTTVKFTLTATKEKIDSFEKSKGGLLGKFKLSSSISTTNMNMFDELGRIVKYAKPEDIMKSFYLTRLDFYGKRKQHLLKELRRELKMLSNKARFVLEVCNEELVVNNRKRKELLHELRDRKYDLFDGKDDKKQADDTESDTEMEDDSSTDADLARGYEYLLGMKIWNLTFEKVEQIQKQVQEKEGEVEKLEGTSPSEIWENDLKELEIALDERDESIAEAENDERKAQKKNSARRAKNAKKATKKKATKKKKKDEWDSDMEDEDDEPIDLMSEDDDDFETTKVSKKSKATTKSTAKKTAVSKKKKDPPQAIVTNSGSFESASTLETLSSNLRDSLNVEPKETTKKSAMSKKKSTPPPPSLMDNIDAFLQGTSSFESSTSSNSSSSKGKKRPSPEKEPGPKERLSICHLSSSEAEDDEEVVPPVAKRSRAVPKSKAKPKAKAKAAAPKKTTASTKTKKAKEIVIESSEDEASFAGAEDSDSEISIDYEAIPSSSKATAPSRTSSRRGATAAKKTYVVDSSSEEEDESDFDD